MSTTPETDPADATVDPVPAAPAAPDAPSPAPDATDKPEEDSEKTESEQLDKAMELISKVAKEGEKSGVGVDALAEAAFFFRNSVLTRPFWAAWNLAPAGLQRELAMAEQSVVGEWSMRYLTPLNPRAYFLPGVFLAGLARTGVLKFKLNTEEETQLKTELGETPEAAAKVAFEAGANEKVIDKIVLPGEGVTKIVTGPLGKIISVVQPELAPVVGVAKAGEMVEGARDGYFLQIRERVNAMEVEAAQKEAEAKAKTAVPDTVVVEHNAVAAGLEPEVHVPPLPANNSDHFSEVKAA